MIRLTTLINVISCADRLWHGPLTGLPREIDQAICDLRSERHDLVAQLNRQGIKIEVRDDQESHKTEAENV